MSKEQLIKQMKTTIEQSPQRADIRKLSLFGSYLTGESTENSDIDVLVEFLPNAKVGFFKMYDVQKDLEKAVNKRVDLLTANQLSRHFRSEVLKHAEAIYER
ncbi:nucleotidyltransferase [candidate division WWE3 bacterium CG08_land_8_20_14_0_20_40_13]|uniref:Nucleotidyltransferase n=1 Tax=candidate division WWE3 bacterium CG08_land_8_20_14_0_20_40_13 TaxID=1975084 RepID=A0A2H0XER2_UNCKA|nr:MAG: nucleotidyltransferase [candidate division WWE3 bacterium CG08_land_8_20_14_0_20_40_13]